MSKYIHKIYDKQNKLMILYKDSIEIYKKFKEDFTN